MSAPLHLPHNLPRVTDRLRPFAIPHAEAGASGGLQEPITAIEQVRDDLEIHRVYRLPFSSAGSLVLKVRLAFRSLARL